MRHIRDRCRMSVGESVRHTEGESRVPGLGTKRANGIAMHATEHVVRFYETDASLLGEARDRIFERFFRARADDATQGLGLYVSRQIVELHGGQIRADFPTGGG